ncbi:MAG: hypothetical protein ABJO29_05180 [Yoonia sp.]|uniref:hypothetical protein n=1 Tax=Yoonia sp. TaxID=2212373 RepID=UPI003296AEDF
MKFRLSIISIALLAGCALPPPDPALVADQCEQRARDAQGPTGEVTVGFNNRSGGFADASVGVTSDFLRGLDPIAVYERCVFQRTGELPIRPPVLRNR